MLYFGRHVNGTLNSFFFLFSSYYRRVLLTTGRFVKRVNTFVIATKNGPSCPRRQISNADVFDYTSNVRYAFVRKMGSSFRPYRRAFVNSERNVYARGSKWPPKIDNFVIPSLSSRFFLRSPCPTYDSTSFKPFRVAG